MTGYFTCIFMYLEVYAMFYIFMKNLVYDSSEYQRCLDSGILKGLTLSAEGNDNVSIN